MPRVDHQFGRPWTQAVQCPQEALGEPLPALERHAENLGLDLPTFKAALDDEIYRQRVREHEDGALRSYLRATPGFYVNGQVCDVSGGIYALGDRISKLL